MVRTCLFSTLLTLSSLPDSVCGQQYTPFPVANATWNETDTHLTYYANDIAYQWINWIYQIDGDTTLDNLSYHKLFVNAHYYIVTEFDDTFSNGYTYHYYAGGIREDSFRHIFIRQPNSPDALLYDFNLLTGDTTSTVAYHDAIVESTDSFYSNNHWYKRYHLNEIWDDGCHDISLMEGIGASSGFIAMADCFEGYSILNCFTHDGIHIYGDSTIDCDHFVYTGMENEPESNQMSVSPNPAQSTFTVQINGVKRREASIEITNAFGQLLSETKIENAQGKITKQFTLATKGLYFITIRANDSYEIKKIIIQ